MYNDLIFIFEGKRWSGPIRKGHRHWITKNQDLVQVHSTTPNGVRYIRERSKHNTTPNRQNSEEKERGRHFLRSNPFSWHFLGIFSWRPSDLSSSFALRFFSFWSTPPTASTSPASVLRTFRRSVPSLFPCFRFVFFAGSVWILLDLAGCVWLLRKWRNNERHCCLSFVFGVVLACVEGKRRISWIGVWVSPIFLFYLGNQMENCVENSRFFLA